MRTTPKNHLDHGNDPILGFRLAAIQRVHQNWLGVPSSGTPNRRKIRLTELLNVPYSLILAVFVRSLTQPELCQAS
jgi:hypothetical protein